jgi:hypothetical protein
MGRLARPYWQLVPSTAWSGEVPRDKAGTPGASWTLLEMPADAPHLYRSKKGLDAKVEG